MKNTETNLVPVISLVTAVCLIGDSFLYIVLPIYWQDAGLSSLYQAGVLLAVNRFVRLPLGPVVTWLYRKMSIRAGILLAVLLAGITTASYGLVSDFWLWLLLRSVWGFTWSLLRLGAYFAILTVSDKENHGRYMGTYNGLYRLGSLAGMLLGGFLTEWYGLQTVALLFAVPAFLSIPFVLRYVSNVQLAGLTGQNSPLTQVFSMLAEKQLMLTLMAGMFIAMFYQGILASTISHVMYTHLSSHVILFGVTIASVALAGILQALRWGWEPFLAPWFGKLSDIPGRRHPFFIATLLGAALLIAFIPSPLPPLWWILLLIGIQITATVLTTLMDALAAEAAPASSPMIFMSVYSIMLDLGAAIGPILAYLASEQVLYRGAALLFFLLAVGWPLFCRRLSN